MEINKLEYTVMDKVQWRVGQHALQFQCDWAVFPKERNSSLCYCTSEERATWIAMQLNRIADLIAIEKAAKEFARNHKNDNEAASKLFEFLKGLNVD